MGSTIHHKIDLTDAKVLDLTDDAVRSSDEWGSLLKQAEASPEDYDLFQTIAKKAMDEPGYNVIKFESYRRDGGVNYALLDNFDFDSNLRLTGLEVP